MNRNLSAPRKPVVFGGMAFLVGLLCAGAFYDSTGSESIHWGARIRGRTYGLNDALWNPTTIDIFERNARKKGSLR